MQQMSTKTQPSLQRQNSATALGDQPVPIRQRRVANDNVLWKRNAISHVSGLKLYS